MPTFQSFEDIKAWQHARKLSQIVYSLTKNNTFCRDYSLLDQVRRSSVSVMSNIAEGFGRGGSTEFIRFLAIASGSANELKSQFYVALDQKYVTEDEAGSVMEKCDEVARLLWGLMEYLKKSDCQGLKYKN